MVVQLLMPALSPTMKDGLIAQWKKKEGDNIKIGDILVDIGTDKATMELESIYEGKLAKILVQDGTENVIVNSLIAIILEEEDTEQDLNNILNSLNSNDKVTKNDNLNNSPPNITKDNKPQSNIVDFDIENNNKIAASPLARRLAIEHNISLAKITGSGPRGRIIRDDILNAKNNNSPCVNEDFKTTSRNPTEYNSIINNNMRKIIAKRLSDSKRDIPHFYLEIECEMDNLLKFRKELNSYYEKSKLNHKISVNDFIIKSVASSLKKVPVVNSSWTEEATLHYNNIDIAVAVAIDNGLITPIITNADHKNIAEISEKMKDLAKRAKNSSLKPEEFQGGSFAITNLGMFGIDNFKAIINPPQSAILAIGATSEKPIVKNGNILISSIMKVTLSCDHRIIDGAVAALFLTEFKNFMENPHIMLAI